MSQATSTVSTALGSATARSQGDVKVEYHNITIVSGDTTAVSTGYGLHRIDYAILCADVRQTTAATYSGNTATFTFADPVATVVGTVILIGR